MMSLSRFHWRNYIGGQWRDDSSLPPIPVINPSDESQIAVVSQADHALADDAFKAARACVQSGALSAPHPKARMAMLLAIARELRGLRDEVGQTECLDNGKPLEAARAEADEAARIFEYYAGVADKVEGVSIPLGDGYVSYTERVPFGVTLHIIPYNYPLTTAARSVAPALAAGNACVVKSPETSPLSVLLLAEACGRAEVPDGALSVMCGYGHDLGAYLVQHAEVDHIVFTGSVASGKKVLHSAADTITPTVMELGGKSAALLLEDADLDQALESVCVGIFCNSGQICSASSRLLVKRGQLESVYSWFRARLAGMTVGPADENPNLGPLITSRQQARVLSLISQALEEGATLVAGSQEPPRPKGFFVAPTVLGGVTPAMTIATTEVFGPVLSILAYDDLDEAIGIANSTPYGLVGGIFTRDLRLAHQLSRRMKCGQVFVNEWFAGGIETPFGGVGHSGFGREKGLEGVLNYVRTRTTTIKLP